MIQRIQSVYLLLAGIFPAITFFAPVAIFINQSSWFTMSSIGYDVVNVQEMAGRHPWGLAVFALLSTLLALTSIFSYKKRKRQLRLVYTTILSNVVWYAAFCAYAYSVTERTGITPSFALCCLLPLLSIITLWMAARAIRRDEALVKAADRIR